MANDKGAPQALLIRSVPLTLCLLASVTLARAQQLEAIPPPIGERVQPYLSAETAAGAVITTPPPTANSVEDRADLGVVQALEQVSSDRWQEAELDALTVYPRFEGAFGAPINRTTTPRTVALLNRAALEVARVVFFDKDQFQRLRPYQRVQLPRICGQVAPAPDPNATDRSSYPSGHAAFGWMTGAVLSRLAPDRAGRLMQRASAYGTSRVVCGMHFPSDVMAGEAAAEAVLAELDATREFRRDLERAKAEIATLRRRL